MKPNECVQLGKYEKILNFKNHEINNMFSFQETLHMQLVLIATQCSFNLTFSVKILSIFPMCPLKLEIVTIVHISAYQLHLLLRKSRI